MVLPVTGYSGLEEESNTQPCIHHALPANLNMYVPSVASQSDWVHCICSGRDQEKTAQSWLAVALSPGLPRPKSQLWIIGLGRPGDEATCRLVYNYSTEE